ncbi:MAG: ribonuclease HII [Candidatus Omnitrophica bacterium]|nr:ribonuclease HII [Candidatus Omnitrophota bacterium]
MLTFENQAKAAGFRWIIGIDEAGRGPLAGPVVASAVMLRTTLFENKIKDSKKMTERQRERAFFEIFDNAYVGIGIMNEKVIDLNNILQATFLAMATAVRQLTVSLPSEISGGTGFEKEVVLLVDGPHFKSDLPYNARRIIDGDAYSLSIACASIVAKVTRDRILKTYDSIYPQYGFKSHKGYGTASHRKAILENGLSPIHRRSFQVKDVVFHDAEN